MTPALRAVGRCMGAFGEVHWGDNAICQGCRNSRKSQANSSCWVHGKWRRDFAWQTGYGAFTVSESNRSRVVEYILHQEEHHRKMTFEEELIAILKKQGI